jgi:hypothetical protein
MWEAFRSPKRGRAKGSGCVCSDTIQNGCKTNLQVLYSDPALKYSDKSCGQSERRKFRELARSWTLHSCVWSLPDQLPVYIFTVQRRSWHLDIGSTGAGRHHGLPETPWTNIVWTTWIEEGRLTAGIYHQLHRTTLDQVRIYQATICLNHNRYSLHSLL